MRTLFGASNCVVVQCLVARTNCSDLFGATATVDPTVRSNFAYSHALFRSIEHLGHVMSVESQTGIDLLPLVRGASPLKEPNFYPPVPGSGDGAVNGWYFDPDKVTVTQGRMANPSRAIKEMFSADGTFALRADVGAVNRQLP